MNHSPDMTELDSIHAPLAGVNLIEAAAGTGKTHNIQNLVARLIVEKDLPVAAIVVVTFTEAAAAELADRLRAVLVLLDETLADRLADDPVQRERAAALLGGFDACGIAPDVQRERIRRALRDFDEANVSTIHGFCAKVLSENAFESSIAFRVRLEKNIDVYVLKLLGDFCRIQRYAEAPLPGALELRPEKLLRPVMTILSRDRLNLRSARGKFQSAEALRARLVELTGRLRNEYDYARVLAPLEGRLKKAYNTEFLRAADAVLSRELAAAEPAVLKLAGVVAELSPAVLAEQALKRPAANAVEVAAQLSGQPFFETAREFAAVALGDCPTCLKLEAAAFVRRELKAWKKRDNFQGFDDLLLEVRNALRAPDGRLAASLRKNYHAAVIDEFQDTDPVQYEIFHTVFAARPDPVFFMVGDPRQAIYTFRGGDLATYLKAVCECRAAGGRIYSLSTNYRSSAALVGAVNTFFGTHRLPFAAPEITFGTVRTPPDAPGITCDGEPPARPLSIRYEPGKKLDSLLNDCADAILEMLNARRWQMPDGRFLEPGDIAVLVYDSRTLGALRAALSARGIPVIGARQSGIWSSAEAGELAAVLAAVLDPGNDAVLKPALLTSPVGWNLADLDVTDLDGAERLSAMRLSFARLGKLWRRAGVAALQHALFAEFGVKARLAALPGGERRIANFTQLGDLLAGAEQSRRLSAFGVLEMLRGTMRDAGGSGGEEELEQLETDRAAVKLMTVHASKGLQFPVVFLPGLFAWYPHRIDGAKVYHEQGVICYNPGDDDPAARRQSAVEELQELLRLVYVAVTRARYLCRMDWGMRTQHNRPVVTSPLDWLFRMRDCDAAQWRNELDRFLDGAAPEPVFPENLLEPEQFPDLNAGYFYRLPPDWNQAACPELNLKVRADWRLVSYSSLPLGENALPSAAWLPPADMETAAPDYDAADAAADDAAAKTGIWAIPGGTAIGSAWHKVLEEIDFTVPLNERFVAEVMRRFGFTDTASQEASGRMLARLLETELPCGMRLNTLGRDRRLSELEFMLDVPHGFALRELRKAVIGGLESEFGPQPEWNEQFMLSGGFFNGFIDLVFEYGGRFYIVDWKSNRLNGDPEAFRSPRLGAAMNFHQYPMQYLCYTGALVKYLELRLGTVFDEAAYERYFGGVYYIFLRGLMLNPPAGIFATRPPWATVRALLNVLTGKEASSC